MRSIVPARHGAGQLLAGVHHAIPQVSGPFVLAAALTFLIIAGVILPAVSMTAVWSRRSDRRKAAVEVLRELVKFLRPGR